ncbi:MAG: isoprenyl transferase [Lysinibacillus sp.]
MFKKFFQKNNECKQLDNEHSIALIDSDNVPSHIAIIMDGNGRWAKQRSMPRVKGHHEGMNTIKRVTRYANKIGINVLTLYAFSTENWKRPKTEVEFLMNLPQQFLNSFLPELMELNIRVQMIGDFDALPSHTKLALQTAMERTSGNTGLILNFAMNYGSRDEIVRAVQQIASKVQSGQLEATNISEEMISEHLYTAQLPEPDLLIRTSGEVRLSNFMLWQLAYTEFWFTDVLWPDFNEETLLEAVQVYQSRNRRYGGLKGEGS